MLNEPSSVCRVCGFELGFHPWGEDGTDPSFDICPCCGTEFGYQDTLLSAIIKARQRWIDRGTRWLIVGATSKMVRTASATEHPGRVSWSAMG